MRNHSADAVTGDRLFKLRKDYPGLGMIPIPANTKILLVFMPWFIAAQLKIPLVVCEKMFVLLMLSS